MTTNAHTHCTTCLEHAREIMIEGMTECLVDDSDLDWDAAEAKIKSDMDEVEAEAVNYLDSIIETQRQTLSSNPENTCFFVHIED